MHTDLRGNTSVQEFHAKRSRKETKIEEFTYIDTKHVECEMYDQTATNWSLWNINKI
jgi:hypothetical protein